MLALPRSQSFIAKYGRDVHSYIVGTERKEKKGKKKNRADRQKKDPAFRRKRRVGNKRANKYLISGGRLMGLLPGVGISVVSLGVATGTGLAQG